MLLTNSEIFASSNTSFASIIQKLETKKTKLLIELYKFKENLTITIKSKKIAKSEIYKLDI